jgi:hypothetical protein
MEDSLQQDSRLPVGEPSGGSAAVFKSPDSFTHWTFSRDKVMVIHHQDLTESQL